MASLMEIAQSLVRDRNRLLRNIEIQGVATNGIQTFTQLAKLVLAIENETNGTNEILNSSEIDISTWSEGTFTETLEDGTIIEYTVTFDEEGKPTLINDGTNNCRIRW